MERLKMMKENLMSAVQGQMGNLHNADTKELGEAVDMIKDLSEAIYYCTITEAMNKKEEHGHESRYYPVDYQYEPKMYPVYYTDYRDMDRYQGRMYYNGNGGNSGGAMSSGGRGGTANLEIIDGKPKTGLNVISMNVSNWKKKYQDCRIIDVSASGLFEKASDNLLDYLK